MAPSARDSRRRNGAARARDSRRHGPKWRRALADIKGNMSWRGAALHDTGMDWKSHGVARHDEGMARRAMARHSTTKLGHSAARLEKGTTTLRSPCVHRVHEHSRVHEQGCAHEQQNVAFTNTTAFTNTLRSRCVHAYPLRSLRSGCVLRSHGVHCVHGPLRSPETAFTCN